MTNNAPKPLLLDEVVRLKNELSRFGNTLTISDPTKWSGFLRVLNHCDGRSSIPEIAAATNTPLGTVADVLRDLEAHGFVWLLSDYDEIPVAVFRAEFKRWLPIWVEEMYDQKIWEDLYKGIGPVDVMIGWAIENMHYTRSVAEHMTWAFALANGSIERQVQVKHLSEEWDHHYLFMKGCTTLGLEPSELRKTSPLTMTKAISNFMRSVAQEGVVVYNACEALLEATTEPNEPVVDFYETVGKNFRLPSGFTQELIRHVKVDADFEHIDIFDHLLDQTQSISKETARSIFRCCSRLASLYALWNTEIATHYGR
jgi:hypothetical protein